MMGIYLTIILMMSWRGLPVADINVLTEQCKLDATFVIVVVIHFEFKPQPWVVCELIKYSLRAGSPLYFLCTESLQAG